MCQCRFKYNKWTPPVADIDSGEKLHVMGQNPKLQSKVYLKMIYIHNLTGETCQNCEKYKEAGRKSPSILLSLMSDE